MMEAIKADTAKPIIRIKTGSIKEEMLFTIISTSR